MEKEKGLTWVKWQITNWWWIPAIMAIGAFIVAFAPPYDAGFWIWESIFTVVFLLSVVKGIILDWKEYRDGFTS